MIRIYKHVGETPLEALQRFRTKNPGYNDKRLSYAGRLDPMAEGELLVLEGEENDRRGEFLGLDKTYEFQILFGYATDSFDLLGLPQTDTDSTFKDKYNRKDKLKRRLTVICEDFKGSWSMRYPPYSSKTVGREGKQTPLWQLARFSDLPDNLPEKSVEIYDLELLEITGITAENLLAYIKTQVGKVNGDFRQEPILRAWDQALQKDERNFPLITFSAFVSAGTYIRRLAHEMGKSVGIPACAFKIKRTKIGQK